MQQYLAMDADKNTDMDTNVDLASPHKKGEDDDQEQAVLTMKRNMAGRLDSGRGGGGGGDDQQQRQTQWLRADGVTHPAPVSMPMPMPTVTALDVKKWISHQHAGFDAGSTTGSGHSNESTYHHATSSLTPSPPLAPAYSVDQTSVSHRLDPYQYQGNTDDDGHDDASFLLSLPLSAEDLSK
jgi:hypothetical protein